LLVLLPLGSMAFQALGVGLHTATRLLFRPLVGELLLHTLAIAVSTALSCAAIGTAAAWFVERTDLPARRLWSVLAVVPLAIPAFISSYAWISLSPGLQDFWGALLVVTSAYFPLVYLPVAAALRGMDPTLEETARSLGCGPWDRFFRVVLPQLRPALLGGMLLVTLDVLAEFGAFGLLRYRTFTTEIYAEYRTSYNGPGASLLAGVLILLCLVCLAAELKVRGAAQYGRIGRGTLRRSSPYELGAARIPVVSGFILLAAVTIGVPLLMIAYWLTQEGAAAISPAQVSAELLLGATGASLGYGLAGAVVTTLLALPLGFLATHYRGRVVTLLERAAYLAQGVPGIVIALAIVALSVHALNPLYQTAALLVVAYAILFLPLALVSVRAAFVQAQPGLEESARALGLGWIEVARRVMLPLAAPGLGAAGAMVFVSVVTELTTTLLLAPIGTKTLATQIWVDTSALAFAAAAPYAALLVTISLASSWLLASLFGRSAVLKSS
jgi:iron(III) transport system permease protein